MLLGELKEYPICLIHVDCPVDVLQKRETLRKDRTPGTAESSRQYLYPQEGYDLTVDTYALSLKDCIAAIEEKL